MNFGDSTDPLAFTLAQSFTRSSVSCLNLHIYSHLHVRRFDFITIGFRFVLLTLSLRRNSIHSEIREAYAKLIKSEWSQRSNKSSYSPFSLRINFHSVLFYILYLIKLSEISSEEKQKIMFVCCSSCRSVCVCVSEWKIKLEINKTHNFFWRGGRFGVW